MLLRTSSRKLARLSNAASSYAEVWRFVTSTYIAPASPVSSRPNRFTRTSKTSARLAEATPDNNAQANLLRAYKASLKFPTATHQIKNLDDVALEDEEVVIYGYLGNRSDLSKNFYFVPLISEDLSHSVQIISSAKFGPGGSALPAHDELKQHGPNTPVVIKGRLKARKQAPSKESGKSVPASSQNSEKDGEQSSAATSGELTQIRLLEIALSEIQVLNHMPKDILVTPEAVHPPEQRHLQIRQDKTIRDALQFRSNIATLSRNHLKSQHEFVEIETPLLFKSTPEGAREFIVPTRRKGMSYALPQSPQQFKQILMGSGIHRYYQIARCFRDEDLRADRQPEFTQLDLEMSFAGSEDVIKVITNLVQTLWRKGLNHELPKEFRRMKYADAMAKYGVDKPDLRYGMELHRVDHLLPVELVSKISPLTFPSVDALVMSMDSPLSPNETRQFVASFLDSQDGEVFQNNPDGGPGIFIYDSGKPLAGLQPLGFEAAEQFEEMFDLKDGDLIVLQARKDVPFSGGSIPLGNMRTALYREAVKQELMEPRIGFEPLWVTDFPLFSPILASEPGQGGAAGLASTHHPFTSPKSPEDVDLLLTSPSEVIGDHYDLVMNGIELGGGSRRIHNADMQRFIMERVLQMSPDRVAEFSHLLEVLYAGCPPHAGIALGFDRLIAVMLGKSSVRDVIAFPKSGSGEDPLVKSPGVLSEAQLETYHLELRKN